MKKVPFSIDYVSIAFLGAAIQTIIQADPKQTIQRNDLSLPLQNFCYYPNSPEIVYWNHHEGTRRAGIPNSLNEDDFPEEMHLAIEKITLASHSGTHMDAPYHYGPQIEGKPGKTVDQIPLGWCYGDGVVLDLTHKKRNELITAKDLRSAPARINYIFKPWDIVLLRTDAYKYFDQYDYTLAGPGMGRESTLWLVEQGVKVMGINDSDSQKLNSPTKRFSVLLLSTNAGVEVRSSILEEVDFPNSWDIDDVLFPCFGRFDGCKNYFFSLRKSLCKNRPFWIDDLASAYESDTSLNTNSVRSNNKQTILISTSPNEMIRVEFYPLWPVGTKGNDFSPFKSKNPSRFRKPKIIADGHAHFCKGDTVYVKRDIPVVDKSIHSKEWEMNLPIGGDDSLRTDEDSGIVNHISYSFE